MQTRKTFLIIGAFFSPIFFLSNGFAGLSMPKQLQCRLINKTSQNRECTYRVKKGESNAKVYATTNMPYALCSKSLCRIASDKSRFTICTCLVFGTKKFSWRNASVGPKPFNQSKPLSRNKKLIAVTSNFSMANVNKSDQATKTVCRSNKAMPWANCFGIRCKVRYKNNRGIKTPYALCRCPVSRTKVFSSLGVTNVNKCKPPKGRVWSAATNQQRGNNVGVMLDIYKRYYSKTALN